MSTVLQLTHWLAGFIVLAEALNKLERCNLLAAGLNLRLRVVEVLKALAWAFLALGAGGAVATPLLLALGVVPDQASILLRLERPTLAEVCVLFGFAVLIVRTRVKEGWIMISAAEYFGRYAEHPDATAERRYHATALLDVVNDLLEAAAADGCILPKNPATKSRVAGNGNGGFRPQDSRVGAGNSKHKDGRAVDIFDPDRQFASWCLAHPEELENRGLHMEDPRWTPTWVHLQDVPPGSGRLVYIPSTAPALASAPAKWKAVA